MAVSNVSSLVWVLLHLRVVVAYRTFLLQVLVKLW